MTLWEWLFDKPSKSEVAAFRAFEADALKTYRLARSVMPTTESAITAGIEISTRYLCQNTNDLEPLLRGCLLRQRVDKADLKEHGARLQKALAELDRDWASPNSDFDPLAAIVSYYETTPPFRVLKSVLKREPERLVCAAVAEGLKIGLLLCRFHPEVSQALATLLDEEK